MIKIRSLHSFISQSYLRKSVMKNKGSLYLHGPTGTKFLVAGNEQSGEQNPHLTVLV